MKISVAVVVAAFSFAVAASRGITVSDDFTGSAIDSSRWIVFKPFPSSQVNLTPGTVTLFSRGGLETVADFSHQIEIDGRFDFGGALDNFKVTFRSDLSLFGPYDEINGDLAFFDQEHNTAGLAEAGIGFLAQRPFQFTPGTSVTFRILDDGTNIKLFINDLANPFVTAVSAHRAGQQCAVYNREILGTAVNLHFLAISDIPVVGGQSGSKTVEFSDATFDDANWALATAFNSTAPGESCASAAQVTTGGNPGAFRATTLLFGHGELAVSQLNRSAIYDPSTQGAILSVDYGYDFKKIFPVGYGAINYALAINQNGTVFVDVGEAPAEEVWTRHQHSGLVASDFSDITLGYLSGPNHPDFSATAPPLQFGYLTANDNPAGPSTSISGIDNWTVQLHVNPPSSIRPDLNWPSPSDLTYGAALGASELNATATDPNTGQPVSGVFTYNPALGTVLNAGSKQPLSVTFTPADSTDYQSAAATVTINVLQALLTVVADNQTRVYGTANPPLTGAITGIKNNDPISALYSTAATLGSIVGSYPITISMIDPSSRLGNYTLTEVPGTLMITPAPLTATITGPQPGSVALINSPIEFDGSFNKSGIPDYATTWTFQSATLPPITASGDILGNDILTGTIQNDVSFPSAGLYVASLNVADDSGKTASASTVANQLEYVAVIDPSAGFLTGGGWINVSAGMIPNAPAAAGKGRFGLEARYDKSGTLAGNVDFVFTSEPNPPAKDSAPPPFHFKFKATALNWLVIEKGRADLKGTGTIDQSDPSDQPSAGGGTATNPTAKPPLYGFFLTAIAGEDAKTANQLRLFIWDPKSDQTWFDNQPTASVIGALGIQTDLGGGGLTIHAASPKNPNER